MTLGLIAPGKPSMVNEDAKAQATRWKLALTQARTFFFRMGGLITIPNFHPNRMQSTSWSPSFSTLKESAKGSQSLFLEVVLLGTSEHHG